MNDLLVSGYFADGDQEGGLARWDGEAWHLEELTAGSMASHEGALYLGGVLGHAGGGSYVGVARWTSPGIDPICYSRLGSVYGGQGVWALHSWNGQLIAGAGALYDAGFEMVGGFDGSRWQRLDFDSGWLDEGNPSVRSFATWQGKLVAGGWFRLTRSPSSSDVVVYDGASWTTLGSGIGHIEGPVPRFCHPAGWVQAMAEFNGSLYVAGSFREAGRKPSWNIARWDP